MTRPAPSPTADEARTELEAAVENALVVLRTIAGKRREIGPIATSAQQAAMQLSSAATLLSRIPSEEAVWIKWPGGDCPVPVETFVEAEFRNAQIDSDVARRFIWDHTDSRFDIVAFRITRAPGAGP